MIKTSPDPLMVLSVGGGSILVPESLSGASEIIRPPFHEVANAAGASVSQIKVTVDFVQDTTDQMVPKALQRAKKSPSNVRSRQELSKAASKLRR